MASTSAVLVARIRSRERLMEKIARRNPESYRTNPHYLALQTAVRAYRDALSQIERVGVGSGELTYSR